MRTSAGSQPRKSHAEQRFPDPPFPEFPPVASCQATILRKHQFKVQENWKSDFFWTFKKVFLRVLICLPQVLLKRNRGARFPHPEFPVPPPAAIPSYVNLLSAPCRSISTVLPCRAVVLPFLQYCSIVEWGCVVRPSHGRCRR